MTLMGKIFRPWDLASSETEAVSKSNEDGTNRKELFSEESEDQPERKHVIPRTSLIERSVARRPSVSEAEKTNHEKSNANSNESTRLANLKPNPINVEEPNNMAGSAIAHLIELNQQASSMSPFFMPGSPVGTPTTPNFMSSSSINELASLSRGELTAMGLLPPEPPSSMKVKRQRPKRFRCPHCQVAFSNNGQLRGHIRIHTGERPFACEHEGCGKSFTRNEELTRHRRIHTGLRPYPCNHCGKKFGRKDHLKKHTRTHQRPMYNASSGMIGLGNPFHPFNPSLIPSHAAINEYSSVASPYALPFMLTIPPPISHFPFS